MFSFMLMSQLKKKETLIRFFKKNKEPLAAEYLAEDVHGQGHH
jgi:hypothetical protein